MRDITPDEYLRALHLAVESRRASKHFLQRQLRVSFQKADALIYAMEQAGHISPPNTKGRRAVIADEGAIAQLEEEFAAAEHKGDDSPAAEPPLLQPYRRPPAHKAKVRWSPEIEDEICDRTANGETLAQIFASPHMPSKPTFFRWLSGELHLTPEQARALRIRYDQARLARADRMAAELLAIADDASRDRVIRQLPAGLVTEVVDFEHIQRSRLRVDARKWILARLFPEKFGEKLQIEQSKAEPRPESVLDFGQLTPAAREKLRDFLEQVRADKESGAMQAVFVDKDDAPDIFTLAKAS